MRYLKYYTSLVIPLSVWIAIQSHGWYTYLTVIVAFGIIPLIELVIKPNPLNLEKTEEDVIKNDNRYDYIFYLTFLLQFYFLFVFLKNVSDVNSTYEQVGMIFSFGIGCGVLGINLAHELGHRRSKIHQTMAKLLLMTSLYMHFFIEHNRGHHFLAATQSDPATARKGEHIYFFWIRSVVNSYLSAWNLEKTRLNRIGKSALNINNEMIHFQLIQFALIIIIWVFFGGLVLLCFVASAVIGFLLLETLNYAQHYGLERKRNEKGILEKVQVWHSWNSNHVLGRLILFELTRHSDHHYNAGRKYQILRHHDDSPQLPTGYPGMMLLSLVPPLWFRVMDKKIR